MKNSQGQLQHTFTYTTANTTTPEEVTAALPSRAPWPEHNSHSHPSPYHVAHIKNHKTQNH
eukprot:5405215-Amphidinium_carterae.1